MADGIQTRMAAARLIMLLFLSVGLNPPAEAQTYTIGGGPYANTDGSYTVNWNLPTTIHGTGTTITLTERANGGGWVSLASGSTSVSKAVSRGNGIYDYKVYYCTHYSTPSGPISVCNESVDTVTVAKVPGSPAVSATASDCSTASVSWSAGPGYPSGASRRYDVEESVNGGGYTSILTNTVETATVRANLTENTPYRYRVRAYYIYNGVTSTRSGWVDSALSTPYCPAGTPAIPEAPAVSTGGSYTVDWVTAGSGNNTLYERVNGGAWASIDSATGNGLSRSVSRAQGNGIYDYYAKSCTPDDACRESATATTTVVKTPDIPGTLNFSPQQVADCTEPFMISWEAAVDANRYELQERLNGTDWQTLSDTLTDASLVRQQLPPGDYEYRVRAQYVLNGHGSPWSDWRESIATMTQPECPSPGAVINAPAHSTTGSYTVDWGIDFTLPSGSRNISEGPYILKENGAQIYSGTGTSFSRNHGNGLYTYEIQRCVTYEAIVGFNYGGSTYIYEPRGSCPSATVTVTVTRPPAAPDAVTANAASCTTLQVYWNASADDASGYDVQQITNADSPVPIYNGGPKSAVAPLSLTDRLENTAYQYKVRAFYSLNGRTAYSPDWTVSEAVTTPYCIPGVPGLLQLTGITPINGVYTASAGQNLTVAWSAPSDGTVERYELRSADGGTLYYDGPDLQASVSAGPEGGTRGYKVRACNTGGCGVDTVTASVYTQYAVPDQVDGLSESAKSASDLQFTLNWLQPGGNIKEYVVEQRLAGESGWTEIYRGNTSSRLVTGLSHDQDYQYHVQACNPDNQCGPFSALLDVHMPELPPSAPGVPGNIEAARENTTGDYPVIWGSAAGDVAYYELEETSEKDNVTARMQVAGLSVELNNQPNDLYHYRVRACNSDALCGPWGELASVVVVRPPNPPTVPDDFSGAGYADPGPVPGDPFYGILAGTHQVAAGGALQYSLPIAVPPGTAGVAPKLSLNYSSDAPNGLLGLGWSLAGLSVITRCPQTVPQDGRNRALNMSNTDRFCLDGQKLYAVSGQYGQNGAEYRTEQNSFSRIFSRGTSGGDIPIGSNVTATGGPAYFEVHSKSGEILYYGNTADSRIEAQGQNNVVIWLLNRVEDTFGNYMEFTYDEDSAAGEYRLAEIAYTGNSQAGVVPYHHITFDYEARNDTRQMYVGGSLRRVTQRLTAINTPLGRYSLSYAATGATDASRLQQIDYCAVDQYGDTTDCLSPLQFGWQTASPAQPQWQADNNHAPPVPLVTSDGKDNGVRLIDVNGDGLTDFVASGRVWLNSGEGWDDGYQFQGPPVPFADNGDDLGARFVDLNGDGLPDIISNYVTELPQSLQDCLRNAPNPLNDCPPAPETHFSSVWLNTGTGWSAGPAAYLEQVPLLNAGYGTVGVMFVDINGDQRTDLLRSNGVWLNNGNGWAQSSALALPNISNDDIAKGRVQLLDVNADGLLDLVHAKTGAVWHNTGAGWQAGGNLPVPLLSSDNQSNGVSLVDANGDGLVDLLQSDGTVDTQCSSYIYPLGPDRPVCTGPSSTLIRHVWMNTGIGWREISGGYQNNIPPLLVYYGDTRPEYAGITRAEDSGVRSVDVNGDGLVDILAPGAAWLNTGAGWQRDDNYAAPTAFVRDYGIADTFNTHHSTGAELVDLNGDGRVDILQGGSGINGAWLNTGQRALLTTVTDGFGQSITFDYGNLTDSEVYGAGTPAAGLADIRLPLSVVKAVHTPDGIGGSLTTHYRYSGLKISTDGRGVAGFQTMTVIGPQGDYTTTTFAQRYPYTGMAVRTETGYGGTVLSTSETQYCYMTANDSASIPPGGFCPPYNDFAHNGWLFVYPVRTIETQHLPGDYDAGSNTLATTADTTTVTTDNEYDNLGNPVRVTVTTNGSDGVTSRAVTDNQYGSGELQRLGRLVFARVTTTHPDYRVTVRETAFTYSLQHSLLESEIIEPNGGPELRLETTYTRDLYGNIETTTVSDGNGGHRTTTTSYRTADHPNPASLGYGDGRFPVKTINALGEAETYTYDPGTGQQLKHTGPNGIATCWQYDDLGRMTAEIARCGTTGELSTTTRYRWAAANDIHARTVVEVTPPVGAPSRIYRDAMDREVRTLTRGFEGQYIVTDNEYNHWGELNRSSEPYFAHEAVGRESLLWTWSGFDPLGRVIEARLPLEDLDGDGIGGDYQTVHTYYNGFETRTEHTVSGALRSRIERKNGLGQTTAITDALGNTIHYTHDGYGNLLATTDPMGNSVRLDYDTLGRKIRMQDPDMGVWSYTYNAYGELIGQTDAKGQSTRMAYDVLGRLVARTDLADTPDAQTGTWSYYDATAPLGSIGKLRRTTGAANTLLNAGSCGNAPVTEYTYTQYGQNATQRRCIDGQWFETEQRYDQYGRLNLMIYPDVNDSRLKVAYHYDAFGYLHYLYDGDITPGDPKLFWRAEALNAKGQLTRETYRNGVQTISDYNAATGWLLSSWASADAQNSPYMAGSDPHIVRAAYQYDEAGNLLRRSRFDDQIFSETVEETFSYDMLDRLSTASVNNLNTGYTHQDSVDYDALGNITYRSGRGGYDYNTCTAGTRNAGPHALCGIDGQGDYQYDANGNLIGGGGRTIEYSAFNKPMRILRNNNADVRFIYGADRSRVLRIGNDDFRDERIVYVGLGAEGGTLYERKTITEPGVQQNVTEHMNFLYAGDYHHGQAFGVYVVTHDANTQTTTAGTEYFHRDHLGSIIAITDDTGVMYDAADQPRGTLMSYDAWGKRRNPDWSEGPQYIDPNDPAQGIKPGTDNYTTIRAHLTYTGQESLTEVGLIHMNGRIYDPELGKFLSADPHVQFAADLQSYNRYAYVHNNPLRYTDPTGYSLSGVFKIISRVPRQVLRSLSPGVAGGISAILNFIPGCQGGWCSAGFNAAYASANGANLGQITLSFGIGFASGYLGTQAAIGAGFSAGISTVTSQTVLTTLGGQLFAAAFGGAIAGVLNAGLQHGNLNLGFFQGALSGALMAAVNWAAFGAPEVRVIEESVESDQQAIIAEISKSNFSKNPDFSDNIDIDEEGNVTFKATVSADEGMETYRDVLVNRVNEYAGNLKIKGDGKEYILNIELSSYEGPGEGDIHVATRNSMMARLKDNRLQNPKFCPDACADTGGKLITISNSALSGGRLTHEIFHLIGFKHGDRGYRDFMSREWPINRNRTKHIHPSHIEEIHRAYGR